MRKVLFLASALSFILVLGSCTSKDYTCTCTYVTGGVQQTTVETLTNDTKKQAEDQCNSGSAYHPEIGIGKTTITCVLK